jgi:hypothetical protein
MCAPRVTPQTPSQYSASSHNKKKKSIYRVTGTVAAQILSLWAYNKNTVYAEKITDQNHLRNRIYAATVTVTPKMLCNV